MVVTAPASGHFALIGVDGLTHEILTSRNDLRALLPIATKVDAITGSSTAERWASLASGVPTAIHGVRSLEGIRFTGGRAVLQNVSRADIVLMVLAPAAGVARREPLPPTVRKRDYVWEIFAKRGLPTAAVNWWATADASEPGLVTIAPDSIFAASRGSALEVDALATRRLEGLLEPQRPRFVAVYLPALDVILNRSESDSASRLAQSMQALEGVSFVVAMLREKGYEVVLAGLPGDDQRGSAVIASTAPISPRSSWDVAPTLLSLLGFPASREMPGTAAVRESQPRIESFGSRRTEGAPAQLNEEYYENLRSLGYIR